MKKGAVQNNKTTTPEQQPPEQQIENLIETIQKERRKGADAAFEQGKRFADLRKLTAPYEKDAKSLPQIGIADWLQVDHCGASPEHVRDCNSSQYPTRSLQRSR